MGDCAADCEGNEPAHGDEVGASRGVVDMFCIPCCANPCDPCEKEAKGEVRGADPNCGMSSGVWGLGVVEMEE